MARRFLPVILPGALLLVGSRAAAAGARQRGGGAGRRAAWTFAARTTAASSSWRCWPTAVLARSRSRCSPHVEYAGLIPRLERSPRTIGDRDLLIVESRDASDTHVLALPLAYIYARNVLCCDRRCPTSARSRRSSTGRATHYDRVLFMGGGGTELLSRDWASKPVAGERFQVPEYESPLERAIRGRPAEGVRLQPLRTDRAATGCGDRPFDLDVGTSDDLQRAALPRQGRQSERHTFRWSRDTSYIALTGMPGSAARGHVLAGRRRPAAGAAPVEPI